MYNFKELELLSSVTIPHCGGQHFHPVKETTTRHLELERILRSPATPVAMVEAKPNVKQLLLEPGLVRRGLSLLDQVSMGTLQTRNAESRRLLFVYIRAVLLDVKEASFIHSTVPS